MRLTEEDVDEIRRWIAWSIQRGGCLPVWACYQLRACDPASGRPKVIDFTFVDVGGTPRYESIQEAEIKGKRHATLEFTL